MTLIDNIRDSKLLRTVIFLLAIVHVVLQFAVWLPINCRRVDKNRDMVLYYIAAREVLHNKTLYSPDPGYGPDHYPNSYLYPPQFAVVIAPLGLLSYGAFCNLWYVLELAAFWIFVATLCKIAFRGVTLRSLLIWGLVVGMTPGSYNAMSLGQIDPMLWALYGMALCSRQAASIFAVTMQIKPYGALPLAVSIWKANGRGAIGAACVLTCGAVLAISVTGWHSSQDWWHDVVPLAGQGTFHHSNVSISFAILRLLRFSHLWHYTSGPLSAYPRIFLSLVGLVGPLGVTYLFRNRPTVFVAACSLMAAMLFSPLCWSDYLIAGYLIVAAVICNHGHVTVKA